MVQDNMLQLQIAEINESYNLIQIHYISNNENYCNVI